MQCFYILDSVVLVLGGNLLFACLDPWGGSWTEIFLEDSSRTAVYFGLP